MARPVSSNTTCGGLVWGWSSQPGCIMHENRTMLLPRSVSCSLRNRCWRGARSAGAIQGTALPGSAAAPNAGPRTLHTVTDKPERRRGRPSIAAGSAAEERPSVVASTEARLAWQRPDLHIVLVHPQIPQNAGNIARTCAATAVALHLVEPLGFELNDAKLKRAGLDYWKSVFVQKHASWQGAAATIAKHLTRPSLPTRIPWPRPIQAFYDFFKSDSVPGPKRLVAFTVYGSTYYAGPEFTYQPGDWLLFGSETSGLPLQAHRDIEASGGELVKIPIVDTHVRSLNLAVSVGVAAFEALRQLDAGSHVVAPRTSPTLEEAERSYKERMQQQAGKSETLD